MKFSEAKVRCLKAYQEHDREEGTTIDEMEYRHGIKIRFITAWRLYENGYLKSVPNDWSWRDGSYYRITQAGIDSLNSKGDRQ